MTQEEAIEIIKRKWDDNDGCQSCGWRSCLYEFGDLRDHVDAEALAQGFVVLPCHTDWGDGDTHRGAYVYFEESTP